MNKTKRQSLRDKITFILGTTVIIVIGTILINWYSKSPKVFINRTANLHSTPSPETINSMQYLNIRGSIAYWDQINAFNTVKNHKYLFDEISFFWYYLSEDSGLVKYKYAVIDKTMLAFAKESGIRTSLVVTNLADGEEGNWDSDRVTNLLKSPELRNSFTEELSQILNEYGFDGVTLDFEEVDNSVKENYTSFIADLNRRLKPENKLIGITLHPKTGESSDRQYSFQDWKELSKYADELYIMAYDEHWSGGPPGAVASSDWVKNIINYAKQLKVSLKKFYLGIPFYGYDWDKDSDNPATGLTYIEVSKLMDKYGIKEEWGEETPAPYFSYTDENHHLHEVWFENAASVEEKVNLAQVSGFGGVTFWRLGGEDPGIWDRLGNIEEPAKQ